jgi:hypothetical protein
MPRKSTEYAAFEKLTDHLLSVPRTVIEARLAAYKERAALNPNKRGPKSKVNRPVSRASRASGGRTEPR